MRNPFEPGDLGGLGLDNSSGIWTPGLVIGVVFAGLLTYYAVNPDPEMMEEARRERRKKRGLSGLGGAMQEGRKKSLLAKPVRFQGRQMTKAQMIEELVRQGGRLRADHFQKHVFNRTTFNRMNGDEQAEYAKKMKLKMPFAVELGDGTYFEITQTEAEYFTSLGGSR